ncbi:MAG TPA: hypothetical protein VFV99_09450 [Kofleriaceae bacterium]|nr:hypothetical protein [Kofleriaceae bacterium]
MKRVAILLFAIAACGGDKAKTQSDTPSHDTSKPQTLAEAVTYLCAAPARAKADPAYKQGCLEKDQACSGDVIEQVKLLGKHMEENQSNERVLAFLKVEGQQKGAELAKLTQEAGVTQCELADIYQAPAQ